MLLALAAAIAALLLMSGKAGAYQGGGGGAPVTDQAINAEMVKLAKDSPAVYAIVSKLLTSAPTNPPALMSYAMAMMGLNAQGQPSFPKIGDALTALMSKVDPELIKQMNSLQTTSPQAYTEVFKIMSAPGNPSMMAAYAVQLKDTFPKVAIMLSQRFDETVVKTPGKSGTVWNTWSVGPRPDGWIPVDVLEGAAPVLSYAQNGADKTSRKLIGLATPGASGFKLSANAVTNARADFGV